MSRKILDSGNVLKVTVLTLMSVFIFGGICFSTRVQAQTDSWQVHLNDPKDAPAYWYPDEYDPYNQNQGSDIKLPVKTLGINDSTGQTLTYTFDSAESGFGDSLSPATCYLQIVEITNNSSLPVTITFNGGLITGSIAPHLEQWISGAVALDTSSANPYGSGADLEVPAPNFFTTGITLQPGESTPKFGAAFGMPWSIPNEGMNTSGNISWSWNIVKQVPQTGTVTVHHVEEDERILHPEIQLSGNVGDKYSTSPADIDGYKLVESRRPSNAEGEYISGNIDVTYIYDQINTVTIHYLDEEGNILQDAVVTIGEDGAAYVTSAPAIAGFMLDEGKLPANSTGTYVDGNIDVIYVYQKKTDDGETPANPENPVNPVNPEPPVNPENPEAPEKPAAETPNAASPENPSKPNTTVTSPIVPKPTADVSQYTAVPASAKSDKQTLPKTSERMSDALLTLLGLSTAGIAVLLKKRL